MEYKNIVLKYYWDQPIVQVLTFLRNKQLLPVVTFKGARGVRPPRFSALVKTGIEGFDMTVQCDY